MYVCKACFKIFTRDFTNVCAQTCSDCMASPPCAFSDVQIPCQECNRHFRRHACYVNHSQSTSIKKTVCEPKRYFAIYRRLVMGKMHECNMRFCENCKQKRDAGHLCYMRPLNDALHFAGDKVHYAFYDFETTQITRCTDKATLHVPGLVCVQQFCAQCKDVEDVC